MLADCNFATKYKLIGNTKFCGPASHRLGARLLFCKKCADCNRAANDTIFNRTEFCGPVAQLGERHNGIVEVMGSIPFRSTSFLQANF